MTIRFDALLVRGLADALDAVLTGRRVRSLTLGGDGDGDVVLALQPTGALRLHLSRRDLRIVRLRERLPRAPSLLPAGCTVAGVAAVPDDRLLTWTFLAPDAGELRLVLELLPHRHNAVLLGADDRIRAALFPKGRGRAARLPGSSWAPPDPTLRLGVEAPLDEPSFRALLQPVEPGARGATLIAHVAWTSSINAQAVLGRATANDDSDALGEAWERYVHIAWSERSEACVLRRDGHVQPYPVALPGWRCETVPDLLAAFAAVPAPAGQGPAGEAAAHWRARRARITRRIERLRQQAEGAPGQAAELRRNADLLLAQLDRVPRGATSIELDDFAGGRITVELDPAIRPAEQAARLYAEAKRRDRAAARLPAMLRRAEKELARASDLQARAERGEAIVVERPAAQARPRRRSGPLPYHRFRTTGGLEVRIGRNARANDDLTFHHSSPDDIWLHARDAGGAHVVLRWPSRDANPPAADLREAANLAALHSRARTSGTVPVDWTRRKYVRKPRKSPPGLVMIERARTVFVAPDAGLLDRLRADGDDEAETGTD